MQIRSKRIQAPRKRKEKKKKIKSESTTERSALERDTKKKEARVMRSGANSHLFDKEEREGVDGSPTKRCVR